MDGGQTLRRTRKGGLGTEESGGTVDRETEGQRDRVEECIKEHIHTCIHAYLYILCVITMMENENKINMKTS